MIKSRRSFAAMATAAAALALTACGSSSNSSEKAAQSQLGAIQSAVAQGANAASSDSSASSDSTSSASSGSANSGTATSVDACSLLTAADVNAVAQVDKLDDAQTSSTVYTLTPSEVNGLPGDSVCSFEIAEPAASLRVGTIEFYVADASDITDYSDGAKVSGLGDEAYAIGTDGFAVRVGSRELVANEQDYFSAAVVTDLLHKMIPRLQ